MFNFKIHKELAGSLARTGTIQTSHGEILTPAFVSVGTKATVKGLSPKDIEEAGSQMIIANTYHLYLAGDEKIKKLGGLHKFMNWNKPLMTDSGGFQVFSLGAAYGQKGVSKIGHRKGAEEILLPDIAPEDGLPKIARIDPNGVMFRSHADGSAHYFTPEKSIEIQHNLGADIIFAFDECTSPYESLHYQKEALERTHRWAKRCLEHHKKLNNESEERFSRVLGKNPETRKKSFHTPALFGIIQGGRDETLRKESAEYIGSLDFDGFGIGGSFEKEDMEKAVEWCNHILPKDKPRHLLGIGEPSDLFMAVEKGCDLFDCVAPTRLGRNGGVYTKDGKVNIYNEQYREDPGPIDLGCECYACKNFSRAYVAHLFHQKEMLAGILASIHNTHFIVSLVDKMREEINSGDFFKYKEEFLKRYYK